MPKSKLTGKNPKKQRIRDSLHNLIEFDTSKFDKALWAAIQTPEFQRLRRIKQLGFSEVVYPSATHTRFSHSLGTYFTAKKLLQVIRQQSSESTNEYSEDEECTLAAALLHDVGHGPFSHAFEEFGKELRKKYDIDYKNHEFIGQQLIASSSIGEILNDKMGNEFTQRVVDIFDKSDGFQRYSAVVSSQFDADRLDYMQRDRLMTGTQLAGIDFTWLMANLDTHNASLKADDGDKYSERQMLVLNSKAIHAAESYVLGLFQLYQTVYFHKTTRGVEQLFIQLLLKLYELVANGKIEQTGLPHQHPLIVFLKNLSGENDYKNLLLLDDTVILGALPLMMQAEDLLIKDFSQRIHARRLFKCVDVVKKKINTYANGQEVENDTLKGKILDFEQQKKPLWEEWNKQSPAGIPRILYDIGSRSSYKKIEEDSDQTNQILIKRSSGEHVNINERSKIIAAMPSFHFCRLYYAEEDKETKDFIENEIIKE